MYLHTQDIPSHTLFDLMQIPIYTYINLYIIHRGKSSWKIRCHDVSQRLEVVITCSMDYLIKTWDTKSYKVIQVSGEKNRMAMVFWWGEF